jgi:arachidonate 5-lipoxygenase
MKSNRTPFLKSLGTAFHRLFGITILWVFTKAFTWALTIVGSIISRTKMSHNNGIAAVGSIRFVDNPGFPLHPFFEPGKTLPCRVRHAAASFMDDAMRVVRSMSIKMADTAKKSPMDIELNTGETALFWSIASFFRFAKYKKTRFGMQYEDYYRKYPTGVEGAHVGMRRDPTSFSNLRYHSQTPFLYEAEDNVLRYIKYRTIPAEDVPESGLLDEYDMMIPTENQRILPGETLVRNYLKEEYVERLQTGPIKYKLQVQLHEASDDDDAEVFNSCKKWDEASHPWMDLAEITINKPLDWAESTRMIFTMKNLPKGLGIIPSYSIYDYNSLNFLRRHSDLARNARVWAIKIFGMPPEIPDNDVRNSNNS